MNGIVKPFALLKIYHRCWDEETMAAGSRSDACYIKMRTTGVGLFYGSVCIASARLYHSEKRIANNQTYHTCDASFTLPKWVLNNLGLAMKAIPSESGTSMSLVLDLMCSAEKFPSIMNVLISSFL
jgi:hypothetical protein